MADYDWLSPTPPSAGAPPPPGGGDYDWLSSAPPASKAPPREFTPGESAVRGAVSTGSYGFSPAASGMAAAGEGAQPLGAPTDAARPDMSTVSGRASGQAALRPVEGALRLLRENVVDPLRGVKSSGAATQAYKDTRDAEREANEQAYEQNPKSYIAGAIGGGLATTPANPLGATSVLGRIGEAGLVGAGSGALSGVGESVSRGDTLADTAKNAALGGAVGGAVGGVAGSAVEGLGAAAQRLTSAVRTVRNPEDEALQRIGQAIQTDRERVPPPSAVDVAAARASGLPLSTLEQGGQATRDLARTAINQSPAAEDTIKPFINARFEGQSPRVENFVNQMFHGLDNPQLAEDLRNAYRRTSGPLYERAYQAGDRPIISPELEQLLGSPAVGRAMGNAVRTGQDRATAQGFGAFRPYVNITEDGRVQFPPGPNGVPAYPNLQLWDYTQRELSDMVGQAQRAGRNGEASALTQINTRLRAELDRQVPQFQAARRSAAEYFGANNALEAGRNFVTNRNDLNESGRQIARMTPPERELFARGFAGEFINQVTNTRDRANVLNKIAQSPAARRKLAMAMGPQRARMVDAVLNTEALADRSRDALANSTTTKQLIRAGGHAGVGGAAGAGGVALYEYLNEGGFDPVHVLLGGAALGGLRLHLGHADQQVARRVGEMLVSQDPAIVHRAYQMVAGNPRIFNEIRRVALGTATGAARTAGAGPTAAASAAVLQHLHRREGEHHDNRGVDNLLDNQP